MAFLQITFDEYLGINGLSASGLKDFSKSPAYYRHKRENPGQPTRQMILGTLVHASFLEGRTDYAVFDGVRRGQEYKSFTEDNYGKVIVTRAESEDIEGMVGALKSSPHAMELIKTGAAEQTLMTEHPVASKARFDWVCQERNIICDLKTTADASPEAFAKQVFNLKYHWSAYWYLERYKIATGRGAEFIFLCVENTEPYSVALYHVPDDVISFAAAQVTPLVEQYNECLLFDSWPHPETTIQTLIPPAWIMKEMENTHHVE